MLTLIESGFGSLGHSELIKKIQTSVKNNTPSYLIVPEQQTVTAECEMSLCLPESAPLCFEVTNFTRFANTAFRKIGGICGNYCDSVGKALIMWKTLTELSPLLNITRGKPQVHQGTVKSALAAVGEMQSLGITPEEISEAEKKINPDDKRLNSKLSDLSMIYSLYKKFLKDQFSDSQDDALMLSNMLEINTDFLSDTNIFIEGFTSFTEPQYKLLASLMKRTDVTISLNLPKADENSYEYKEIKRASERLLRIADRVKTNKTISRPDAKDQNGCQIINTVATLLWKSFGYIKNEDFREMSCGREHIRIFQADNPFEECDFLASDIKKRVIAGENYSDFAIIARRAEDYIGIIDTSLSKSKIPHFISKRRDINSFEAIKLIYTAYAIITRGFKREDVLTYLKCGLSNINRDESDLFEMYVDTWGIDGIRFTDGLLWNMNPRGYTEMRGEDSEKLILLNGIRKKLISPLIKFSEDDKSAKTVREHAQVLISFLNDIELEKGLIEKALELEEIGEHAAAEENTKLWKIICNSLDTVVAVLGDVKADSESFVNQLSVVFSEESVGRIPARKDEVVIGSADMIRLQGKKHVYLIGVNAGEFPAYVNDVSYFTDRDKIKLSELGLPTEPETDTKNARELYSFTRAFTFAKDSVTIIFCRRSATMSKIRPSDVIQRIEEISNGEIKIKNISDISVIDKLYCPDLALEALGDATKYEYPDIKSALLEAGKDHIVSVSEGNIKNSNLSLKEDTSAIIYDGDIYLSQTKLETFLSCPMSYFCKYILKLDEGKKASLNYNVVGSFIHGIFESFFTELRDTGSDVKTLSRKKKEEMTKKAAKKYIETTFGDDISTSRTRLAISRLSKVAIPVVDSLCEELENCKYKPVFFELKTDSKNKYAPNPIYINRENGTRIIIGGTMDRVDTYKDGEDVYVRIIDYKTGSKVFSPSDIEKGFNLQMLLYLKSVVETENKEFKEKIGLGKEGKLIPAGIIYVKTAVQDALVDSYDDSDAEIAIKKKQERSGMLLNDEKSICAMNPNFMPKKWEENRYSKEEWENIGKTVTKVISELTDKISGGDIRAVVNKEKRDPCKFCPYKSICRNPQS